MVELSMKTGKDVSRLLEMAPDAVPLPVTTMKIIKLMGDDSSSMDEVARVLETDQALTVRVLRVANSAYYGLPRQVSSARDAVVLLGQNTLRSLIFTASVSGVLGRKASSYALEEGELWKHSISVAAGSRLVAQICNRSLAEEAYVAGLLHDIGKIVLDQFMKDEFEETLQLASESPVPFHEAEREVFGVDHAAIGGMLAERWELPQEYVSAIRFHHDPLEAEDGKVLASIVHVADLIAMELGLGLGADGLQYPMVGEAFELAGVTPEHYTATVEKVASMGDEAAALLN